MTPPQGAEGPGDSSGTHLCSFPRPWQPFSMAVILTPAAQPRDMQRECGVLETWLLFFFFFFLFFRSAL